MVKPREKKGAWWLAFGTVALATACALFPGVSRVLPHDTIVVVPAPPAEAPPDTGFGLDATHINTAVQDATGRIWGINTWTRDAFFEWRGTKWRPHAFAPTSGASPLVLQRVDDGAVLCLWRFEVGDKPAKEHLLCEYKGGDSRVLARWTGEVSGQIRLFRSKRATWITIGGTDIYRVQNGAVRRVYHITPRQMHSGMSDPPNDAPNPLEVLEDARGHFYFWSNEFEEGFNELSLRGLLEFDGQKWTHHARLNGVTDKPFTALITRDAHTFWLAVGDGDLFQVDARTLVGQRIADPIPHAFNEIQTIQQIGGVWYLVATDPEADWLNGDQSLPESDLWRWTSSPQSHFECLLRGLDRGGDFTSRPTRPLLATRSGLWIGALSGGAWWMPFDRTRPPVHVDWRRDLVLSDVSYLLLQRDGRLLASSWTGTSPDLRSYLTVTPVPTPSTFFSYSNVIEDARHHLWRVPNLRAHVLEEWGGTRWVAHPLPTAYVASGLYYLSLDARGRIWLLPDQKDGAVALFQPASGSWQLFRSFSFALQKQLELLGPREFGRLDLGIGKYLVPRFVPPNRIAFRSASEKLCFFDGHAWHRWTLESITHEKQMDPNAWEQTPYFDAAGLLSVNINDKTWTWTPASGWRSRDVQPHLFPATPAPTPPPGCGLLSPESIERDSSGALWMTKDHQLWKAAWGLCAPQLALGERHPARDRRGLSYVLLDPHGTPLLAVGPEGKEEFVWTFNDKPETRVSVTQKGEDAFLLHFASRPASQGKHWFRWRLDNDAWSAPQTSSTLALESVPAGHHRFEVAAINARLQLDPNPAMTTLQVALTSQAQLAKFMAMLRSPDYAKREAAVKAFAKQPGQSLPFLQNARRHATGERLWWINAALQEINSISKR